MIPVVLSALVAVFLMVLFLFLDYLGSRTRVEFLRDRLIFFFSILVGAFVLSWLLFWSLLLCEDSFFFLTLLRASLQLWQSLGCASIVIVGQRGQRPGTKKKANKPPNNNQKTKPSLTKNGQGA